MKTESEMPVPRQEASTGPNPTRSSEGPVVSVVVPVLNEARDIGRLLEELLAQDSPARGFEVLIADGGSTDGTRETVARFGDVDPRVQILQNPRRLSGAARNVGTRAARGAYVLFLDGHCSLPRRDYLVRLVELFETTGADCLCRPQPLKSLADTPWAASISEARHSWLGHNLGSDIFGARIGFTNPRSAGAAYRRTVFDRIGGYDERFDACEDVEFNQRVNAAGMRAYVHPDLAVHYRPRGTLPTLFKQMARYGRGRARLMARHPSVVPWPLLLASVIILGSLIAIALGEVLLGAAILGLPAAVVFLGVAAETIRLASRCPEPFRICAALWVIYAGLLVGFWRGLVEIPRFRAAPTPARLQRSGGSR